MKIQKIITSKINKAFALGLAFLICLAGCSKATPNIISLYDMQKSMVDAGINFPEMITVNSNDSDAEKNFSYISDMEYSKVSEYFLSYSTEGLADEIVVICTKDPSDTNLALESLKSHVESRVKLYDQYEPEQAKRAKEARTFSKEKYAVLIISEDYENIKAAFDSCFK